MINPAHPYSVLCGCLDCCAGVNSTHAVGKGSGMGARREPCKTYDRSRYVLRSLQDSRVSLFVCSRRAQQGEASNGIVGCLGLCSLTPRMCCSKGC